MSDSNRSPGSLDDGPVGRSKAVFDRMCQEIIYDVTTGVTRVKYFDDQGNEAPAPESILRSEAERVASSIEAQRDPAEVAAAFHKLLLAELEKLKGSNDAKAA